MAHVQSALQEVAPGTDLAGLDPDVPLKDQLGLDSVDFLRFVLNISQSLDLKVSGLDYPRLSSLRGALDYLSQRIGSNP